MAEVVERVWVDVGKEFCHLQNPKETQKLVVQKRLVEEFDHLPEQRLLLH